MEGKERPACRPLFFIASPPLLWLNKAVKSFTFFNAKQATLLAFVFIFAISIFLRFYHLGQPTDKVFDEVYFPVFAHNYLTDTDFYDSHPPLGKLIIAGGIALFGNDPVGWRVMNALTGVLFLGVVVGFTYSLTKRWQSALLALTLVAIDPMVLIESRIGLINIYLALFSLIGLWFSWRWWHERQRPLDLAVACIAFGLAIAVKWIGIGALAAVVAFIVAARILQIPPRIIWRPHHFLCLLLIPLAYFLTFIPDLLRGQDLAWWHASSWHYHAGLTATHPYGSAWWTWALTLRPVWLYYQSLGANTISGIIEIGNVVTWVSGLILLVTTLLALLKNRLQRLPSLPSHAPQLYLVITYLALYLPWIFISRVKFMYHYFVPLVILLILMGTLFDTWLQEKTANRWLVWLILIAGTAFFIYFLPLLLGTPISTEGYRHHMWLRSWI